MKKLVRRIFGISFSLMLLLLSSVQVMASSETYIRMSFPAKGSLSLKPFSADQISSVTPSYFVNNAPSASGSGVEVVYKVSLAGYTCVTDPKNDDEPIKVVQTIPDSYSKCFTAQLELGEEQDIADMTSDFDTFQDAFVLAKSLAVTSQQDESYDGNNVTSYKKNPVSNDSVEIEPQKCVPFRITGELNELADWLVGDKIIIVPVFQINVTTR